MSNVYGYPAVHHMSRSHYGPSREYLRLEAPPVSSRRARYIDEQMRAQAVADERAAAGELLEGLDDATLDEQSAALRDALGSLVEAGANELIRRAKFDEETTKQEQSAERRKYREATRRAREECLMGWSLMYGDSSTNNTSTVYIGDTTGWVCGDHCAYFDWDWSLRVTWQCSLVWLIVTSAGLFLSQAMRWGNTSVERFKRQLHVAEGYTRGSYLYLGFVIVASLYQCCSFAYESYTWNTHTVPYMLNFFIAILYGLETVILWLLHITQGMGVFLKHSVSSIFIAVFVVVSVIGQSIWVDDFGLKTWFSFSFFASLRVFQNWQLFLASAGFHSSGINMQIVNVCIGAVCWVYFTSCLVMTLENLEDPHWLLVLQPTPKSWTLTSSFYFIMVTISTVGYGDLSPNTALGRVVAIWTILGGIAAFSYAVNKLLEVYGLTRSGRGRYSLKRRYRHIVVAGTPSTEMLKDFLSEIYHPDHADDSEDLEVVLLFPGQGSVMQSMSEYLRQKENVHMRSRVYTLQGSLLETTDMRRIAATQAEAFFILPNISSSNPVQEDTENLVRVFSIRRYNPTARIIVLLHKAEHRDILGSEMLLGPTASPEVEDDNASEITTLICIDQFKLELIGKTCQVPGLSSLICNLCTSVSDKEEPEGTPQWLKEYDAGLGNELYEVASPTKLTPFGRCCLDVLNRSENQDVYLIGLVERNIGDKGGKSITINPGSNYIVTDVEEKTGVYGVFIASDRDAIVQKESRRRLEYSESDEEMSVASSLGDPLGRGSNRNLSQFDTAGSMRRRGAAKGGAGEPLKMSKSVHDIMELAKEANFHMMSIAQLARSPPNIKQLVFLDKLEKASKVPPAAPEDVLALGGHVILAVAGGGSEARGGESAKIGLEYFVSPMRATYFSEAVPIVVLAPFIPMDWNTVARFPEVYFVQGSALSLFDLERANFRQAATILVFQLGSTQPSGAAQDPYMVDAEAIFTVRLIENHLPRDSETVVVVELVFDENYHYLPQSSRLTGRPVSHDSDHRASSTDSSSSDEECDRRGSGHRETGFFRGSLRQFKRSKTCRASTIIMRMILTVQLTIHTSITLKIRPKPQKCAPQRTIGNRQRLAQPEEYFRQPRFACGQLFVGSVVTSLVANTFYNPSLALLVQQMISSRILMVLLPSAWAGRAYLDLFQHLILDRNLLAIGLFRAAEADQFLEFIGNVSRLK
ncbi:Calcium-activated potassium channel subunit alpha-1 [Perkinsus chesapeaki]|uniref:Calcium-activated potassium channel subunit alpha-1 n=1 Tax=Perkinsus chesapeaki TaxID=330153 RepID=A0A7J6N429_PERCH|nr:Calcium-activated potassium channel subunit alpha-1 [Perkinsus chesapeaki]